MVGIPDRENLESMSRTDIQKLCKDNNIKANMRTDEMIKALCDLVNEKQVPRSTRTTTERVTSQPPRSRLPSMQVSARSASSKAEDVVTTKKAALQPSESNTDVESVVSTPGSLPITAPTTRRKAKDIQTRLGKGRPVAAGGSGARKITKAFSRGTGRKPKTSIVLHAPIAEEDEEPIQQVTPPSIEKIETTIIEPVVPSSSSHASPHNTVPQDTNELPTQLPTPAPSHPSYSLPQISALETRLTHIESMDIMNRIAKVESSLSSIQPPLEVPALKDLLGSLHTANKNVEARVAELTKSHAELKARTSTLENQVKDLIAENTSLKQQIFQLERLRQAAENAAVRSPVPHSPKETERVSETGNNCPASDQTVVPPTVELVDPSPSQPALGKRIRCDTPDTSGTEAEPKLDADIDAIQRVKRPQKKKPRLDPDEDSIPFLFADRDSVPYSTSTPRQPSTPWQRSKSPSGFFTAGREAPTPLEKKKDDMEFYIHFDDDAGQRNDNDHDKAADNEKDRKSPERPKSAIPRTPSPRLTKLSSTFPDRPPSSINDPNFFAGMQPVFQSHVQVSELPFPLIPTTPPNPTESLNQSAQYATPRLGEPWRPQSKVSDTQGSGTRGVNRSDNLETSGTLRSPSPGNYGLHPGGSVRERNDKYNPYFTPQRGPGGSRQRTGLTPIRGFSSGLKSPAPLSTVAEDEQENAEDPIEVSPPQLRTLYGTELQADSRFGDYGRDLGKLDWSKFLPR